MKCKENTLVAKHRMERYCCKTKIEIGLDDKREF